MTPGNGPPAGGRRTLIELAEQFFGSLSPAEKELFQATQEGRAASTLSQIESENDPIQSAKWKEERVVRAKCLVWLCAEPQAANLVSPRGVELHGMKIEGDLDLNKTRIEFSLSARQCAFSGSILLRRAEVGGLYFSRCHIQSRNAGGESFKAFDAEGAKISGGLWLKDRCKVEGEVSLLGTTVSGELDCSDSHFANRGGDDISADGIKTEGDVLFIRCKAGGTVRFLGATIGGDLNCGAAQFSGREGEALNGDGMRVEGDVLLDDRFQARGLVRLSATKIGGNLDCTGSQFLKNGEVLLVEEANIGGNVLFNVFKAEGEVNLARAAIGGNLECEKAQFLNVEDALTADALKITGDVNFGEDFRANGEVRLFGAKIGGDLDCNGAQFLHAGGALSLDGAEIAGDVKFSDVTAKGRVGFPGATIGGDLDFENTQLTKGKDKEEAFTAEGAKIEGTVFFADEFKVEGEVSLIGATIGGDLDFGKAQFNSPGRDAIRAHRTKIGGDVIFGDGFGAEGEVGFLGAIIGGDLECKKGAGFSNEGNDALSAESAKIERSINLRKDLKLRGCLNLQNVEVRRRLDLRGLVISKEASLNLRSAVVGAVQDDETNWKSKGQVLLDGFTYDRFHTEGPGEAASWLEWLQRQPRGSFVSPPYEQLALVLRKMGYEREARRVMIAKNRGRARSTRFLGQGWWWYNLFGWAIGYGYAPWRAFAMSVVMIVVGAVLFGLGESHHLISRTREISPAQGGVAKSEVSLPFDSFFYSLESFTPLLKLGQSAAWTPNTNHSEVRVNHYSLPFTGNFLRSYLYAHIILGWLLTSLWVGAVTGLVKS